MQVVLDEKGIKRGKRKKRLGGTSMGDMVETEQKLKAMQERTERGSERIKEHQPNGKSENFQTHNRNAKLSWVFRMEELLVGCSWLTS